MQLFSGTIRSSMPSNNLEMFASLSLHEVDQCKSCKYRFRRQEPRTSYLLPGHSGATFLGISSSIQFPGKLRVRRPLKNISFGNVFPEDPPVGGSEG